MKITGTKQKQINLQDQLVMKRTVMKMLMVKNLNTLKEMRVHQVITVMTVKKEMTMFMKMMDLVQMQ